MNNTTHVIDTAAVLACFKGKGLDNARAALAMLLASQEDGAWLPNHSRKVRAALSKTSLMAPKALRDLREIGKGIPYHLDIQGARVRDSRNPAKHAANAVEMLLSYGPFQVPEDVSALDGDARFTEALAIYRRVTTAFAPVRALMEHLDACRPKPVFTSIGASPTITTTLEELGATKIEACPMHFEYAEKKLPDGTIVHIPYIVLDWPVGTKFGTSRFKMRDDQCESCGHGIRNPFNWVPMIVTSTTDEGVTYRALWVGRDCAETLLGVKITGELHYAPGVRV